MNFQTTPGHQIFWQENNCLDKIRKRLVHCSVILIARFGQYQNILTEIFQGHYPVISFKRFLLQEKSSKDSLFNQV